MKFAIIENSRSQAAVFKALLNSEGYEVETFTDGTTCLDAEKISSFDFFIIDLALTDIDGDELLKFIRKHRGWQVPIICCAAHTEEEYAADALRLGADDFILKPVRYMEFMARIKSLLRRCQIEKSAATHIGEFLVDLAGRRITLDGGEIDLTQREFDLASTFFLNIGRVFSRDELLSSVWSMTPNEDSRTIDTHASRLRKKLGLGGEHGLVLSSVYGQGYRLDSIHRR